MEYQNILKEINRRLIEIEASVKPQILGFGYYLETAKPIMLEKHLWHFVLKELLDGDFSATLMRVIIDTALESLDIEFNRTFE